MQLLLFICTLRMSRTYKDGPIPIQDRSCTDCLCLIIFIALSVVMFCIGIYAWSAGNFSKLRTAYDPDGKGCGVDYPNYPLIYFASPHADSLWVTVCVSKCPKEGDTVLACQPNSVVKTCSEVDNADNTKSVQIYDTTDVANTVCLPTSTTLKNDVSGALGNNTQQLASLMQNYMLIILALPIAIILALIVMIIVRFTAGCFIYLLILITLGALIGFGAYILTQPITPGGTQGAISLLENQTARTILAVICFVIAALMILFFCCFRKRIELASSIVKVSAVFVAGNCGVVLVPVILFVVMVAFLALWILEALGYYSLGTPNRQPHQYPYEHFDVPNSILGLGVLHLFYLFWGILFLVETSGFLVSGAAASWYYRREQPYGETSERYRKKHMGSVCMGSFFMALVGFIKFMYELLTPQKASGQNKCMQSYKKFCDCICCLCVSYLFQWFNSGAYTVVNIVGDPYCTSAMKAFTIRLTNLATTSVLMILQVIFTILIRIGITALTVLAVYIIIQNVEQYKSLTSDPTLILVIVGLVAFAISCFFISVYSEAMEAIYTTYLLDVEAGGEANNFCPEELQDFIRDAQQEEHIAH